MRVVAILAGRLIIHQVELVIATIKVEVVRQKPSLESHQAYKDISIKSAKSHAERLTENDFKTLPNELQLSDQFRFNSQGRMYKLSNDVDDEATGDDVVNNSGDGWQQNGTRGLGNGRHGANPGAHLTKT